MGDGVLEISLLMANALCCLQVGYRDGRNIGIEILWLKIILYNQRVHGQKAAFVCSYRAWQKAGVSMGLLHFIRRKD